MRLRNKRTKELLDITLSEFLVKFRQELEEVYERYEKSELAMKAYFKTNKDIEGDFRFNLQSNFNRYTNSNWYIEKM